MPEQAQGIFPLTSMAGIKRDGTSFDGNYYSDALWCRFQRGKPRKIGGYRNISTGFSGPVRGAYLDGRNGFNYIFAGSSDSLQMTIVDNSGAGGGIIDRTPSGFAVDPNNSWCFAGGFDAGGVNKIIIAHAAPNLAALDSTVQQPIYYGRLDDTAALITTGTSVSGGMFTMAPYIMGLDNDGYAIWTPPNEPTQFGNTGSGGGSGRIAANKLIKGVRTRGGSGYSPSGLIWSLDELYRTYFIGGEPVFAFDYIGDTALMSQNCVIEYNGRYYWPDLNNFKGFAGTLEDLPNDMNMNYFYDNINKNALEKVWGIKMPRYNEIWWFWPKGQATECTDVIVYNVKEKFWFDTAWATDQLARSCGLYSKSFPHPIMFGLDKNAANKYSIWQHEFGVDRIEGGASYAIKSYFETSDISYCANLAGSDWVGQDRWVQLMRVEPDFVQNGDITITVRGKPYAQQPSVDSSPYVFSPTTGKVDMKEQRRELTLKFESNVLGGDYQLGQTMLHMKTGDGRQ